MTTTATGGPTVVVGVDGSDGSRAALHHALAEATRRRTGVRVIVSYRAPDYWAELLSQDPRVPAPAPGAGVAARARDLVDAVVADRRAAAEPVPAQTVEIVAVAGLATDVLVDAAAEAELLVVGHRGRGARHGRLTGPVAIGCVLRAPCPVTVVPAAP